MNLAQIEEKLGLIEEELQTNKESLCGILKLYNETAEQRSVMIKERAALKEKRNSLMWNS
jgi:hypothetical protein